MQLLIDGYNVLYAAGLVTATTAPTDLNKARVQLLTRLASRVGNKASQATVVFDAARAPHGVPEQQRHRGITVHFTQRGESADDVIERLIEATRTPKQLTVVSNDRRIIAAARRRGCPTMNAATFLAWLEEQTAIGQTADKTRGTPATDRAHWLEEFGHLDNDPSLGKSLPFEET